MKKFFISLFCLLTVCILSACTTNYDKYTCLDKSNNKIECKNQLPLEGSQNTEIQNTVNPVASAMGAAAATANGLGAVSSAASR